MMKYYDKKIYGAIDNAVYAIDKFIDDVLWSIYKLLETLTIVFESEFFDYIRCKYGMWYNLRSLRQNIDFDYKLKIKKVKIRVESMEMQESFITAEIYHKGIKVDKVKEYLTKAVDGSSPGCRENMVIKILDNHHARVIFEYPE